MLIKINTIRFFEDKNIDDNYFCDLNGNVFSTILRNKENDSWIEINNIVYNVLSSYQNKEGYYSYSILTKDKKKIGIKRSQLVYFANNVNFEKVEGWQIDHINRNRSMDIIYNLRYVSVLENNHNRDLSNYKEKRKSQLGLIPEQVMTTSAFWNWCKVRNLNKYDFTKEEAPKETWLVRNRKRNGKEYKEIVKKYYWKVK